MNAVIALDGNLYVQRQKKTQKAQRCFRDKSLSCGDHCPAFQEVTFTSLTEVHLKCMPQACTFNIVEDNRVINPELGD